MDSEGYPAALYKREQRAPPPPPMGTTLQMQRVVGGAPLFHDFAMPTISAPSIISNINMGCLNSNRREISCLEELFKNYGVRYITVTKLVEMGFTANTLVNLTEDEVDDVIRTMVEIYRLELLVGERYGIKSAVRAEKRRIEEADRTPHFFFALYAADDLDSIMLLRHCVLQLRGFDLASSDAMLQSSKSTFSEERPSDLQDLVLARKD